MSVGDLQQIICPKFTEDVLHQIISKKSQLSHIEIDRIEIGGQSKKGDSYLSTVCRFKIYANGKNNNNEIEQIIIPVITKYLPTNIGRRKTFRSVDFFENETIFYEKVWPNLWQFSNLKNMSETFDNIPQFFYAVSDGNNDFISLEDQSFYGYGSVERGNGLDYTNTVVLLKLFARFHSLCLAYKDQQYENFDRIAKQLKETYFDEKYRIWYRYFQENLIKITRDAVEKELTNDYLVKFNEFIDGDFFGRICELCHLNDHKLSVITHGDTWLPNFLFKYHENDRNLPPKIMMIDFQLTRYTILANDLTFFLLTCVDMDVIERNWDELIVEYHRELIENLEKLGTNPNLIKLDEIHENIKQSMTYSVAMTMEGLTMSLLDDDQVSDLDLIQGTEAVPIETVWVMQPFQKQEKRQRFARMVKFVIDKNLI